MRASATALASIRPRSLCSNGQISLAISALWRRRRLVLHRLRIHCGRPRLWAAKGSGADGANKSPCQEHCSVMLSGAKHLAPETDAEILTVNIRE